MAAASPRNQEKQAPVALRVRLISPLEPRSSRAPPPTRPVWQRRQRRQSSSSSPPVSNKCSRSSPNSPVRRASLPTSTSTSNRIRRRSQIQTVLPVTITMATIPTITTVGGRSSRQQPICSLLAKPLRVVVERSCL